MSEQNWKFSKVATRNRHQLHLALKGETQGASTQLQCKTHTEAHKYAPPCPIFLGQYVGPLGSKPHTFPRKGLKKGHFQLWFTLDNTRFVTKFYQICHQIFYLLKILDLSQKNTRFVTKSYQICHQIFSSFCIFLHIFLLDLSPNYTRFVTKIFHLMKNTRFITKKYQIHHQNILDLSPNHTRFVTK